MARSTFLGRMADRFYAWRERERAYAELTALDDRTLADLGLRRGDIPYVVYCKAQSRNEAVAAPSAKPAMVAANRNDGLRAA